MAKKCAADSNKIQSQLSVGETVSTLNMEDDRDNHVDDENYFSLLDMFICTRLDKLMFVLKNIINIIHLRDIFISICESARFTENFFRFEQVWLHFFLEKDFNFIPGSSWWISTSN